MKIAILSDIHFQDVYAKFKKIKVEAPVIRTLESQLLSTRIFNENYFAFLEALDNIVKEKIKYVILNGDLTDDSQVINILGLKKILRKYSSKYNIKFFATFGNHDVNKPFASEFGVNNFLGINGDNQKIFSSDKFKSNYDVYASTNEILFTPEIKQVSYKELLKNFSEYGFFPNKKDLFWCTPFSNYNTENYSYEKAQKSSEIENRKYKVSHNGSYDLLDEDNSFEIIDSSYLVEPEKDLWFLSIDSNVFVPKINGTQKNSYDNFESSDNSGFEKVLTHKKHLLVWIKKIALEAQEKNIKLVTFSHYPVADFLHGESKNIQKIFGKGKLQSKRNVSKITSKTFADIGIKFQFSGHMHFDNLSFTKSSISNFIYDIQTPSLAAFVPAYKTLEFLNNDLIKIETKEIKNAKNFDKFFYLYEKEYSFLEKNNKKLWDKNILKSKNYSEFMNWHIRELVRLRFLEKDWSTDFKKFFEQNSFGKDNLELPIFFHKILYSSNLFFNQVQKNKSKTFFSEKYFEEKICKIKKLADKEIFKKLEILFLIIRNITSNSDLNSVSFEINLKSGKLKKLK